MNPTTGSPPIFLIGFMGCGKSTVARLLAAKTGHPFIELDHRIEQESGSSISEIFQRSGEEKFRQIEADVLRGLNPAACMIIATGGGTPVHHDNLNWMKSQGIVIHLQCRPGVLFHRLAQEKSTRPLISKLNDIDLMGFIMETLKNRLPFYSQAQIQINAENSIVEVADELLRRLKTTPTSS